MTKETEKPPVGLSVRGIYLHTCVKWFLYDRYVFQRGIVFPCYVGQGSFWAGICDDPGQLYSASLAQGKHNMGL